MSRHFSEWALENKELLEKHEIPEHIAEIIWESAKVSVLHNVVDAIQDGSIKLNITF